MNHTDYAHRQADIILNSNHDLKKEIEQAIQDITTDEIDSAFEEENRARVAEGKKPRKGKQATVNAIFRQRFEQYEWECEKNVFNDPTNDLAIDFWKRDVGVDVAFTHRSFIGGDLLRLQAAAEVARIMKVGVYICPMKAFAKGISPRDASSMVNYERTKWYLESFYPVLTVPILLVGLR